MSILTDDSPAHAAEGEIEGDDAGKKPAPAGHHPGAGGKPAAAGGKKKDRTGPIIVVVSIIGVIIAWVSYRRNASGASGADASMQGTGTAAVPSSVGNVAGSGTYQSPNDATAGFQSYLDNMSSQLATIAGQLNQPASGTTDTPTSPADVPSFKRYADLGNGDAIFEIENGTGKWLSPATYKALGKPKYDEVTTQDSSYATVAATAGDLTKITGSGITAANLPPAPAKK